MEQFWIYAKSITGSGVDPGSDRQRPRTTEPYSSWQTSAVHCTIDFTRIVPNTKLLDASLIGVAPGLVQALAGLAESGGLRHHTEHRVGNIVILA